MDGLKLLNTFHEDKLTICQIAWSPDGRTIASGSLDDTIRLWDAETGQLSQTLTGHSGYVISVGWSSDGQILASGSSDRTIRLWNPTTGQLLQTFKEESATVMSTTPSLEKRMPATESSNNLIHNLVNRIIANSQQQIQHQDIWDIATGQIYYTLGGVSSRIALKSRLLPISEPSPKARLQKDSYTIHPHIIQESYSGPIYSLAWSPNGETLAWGTSQESILLLDVKTGQLHQKFEGLFGEIMSLAWSPDGQFLASGTHNNSIQIWEIRTGKLYRKLEGHRGSVSRVVWLPDRQTLASCSHDKTIRIWDCKTGRQTTTIEGHTDKINCITISDDGYLLASKSSDGTVKLWRSDTWEMVTTFDEPVSTYKSFGVAFQPKTHVLATLGERDRSIRIWDLDIVTLLGTRPLIKTVHYPSVKIVLIGENNVGKSCLALRLAEDRYEELSPTYRIRLWSLSSKQLSLDAAVTDGEQLNIVLWDMGGTKESRLIHQLFLHDPTIALIVFDLTQGSTTFEEVKKWNKQLAIQLCGRQTIKLLIGTKLDEDITRIDQNLLEKLIRDCGFSGYYPTSAKTGKGIPELREALAQLLGKERLAKLSRPEFFQRIRNEIEQQRRYGRATLSYADLERTIRQDVPDQFDSRIVDQVVKQLAVQGEIVDTRLSSGERELVIQMGEIVRYADALLIAAQNNPRRNIPAIEKRLIASPKMRFPDIKDEERIYRHEERIVLECVVQLFLEHSICFEHEGLLLFHSLLVPTKKAKTEVIPHAVSLHYDFTETIDNIYLSLVAKLVLSGKFGHPRLFEDRAEFELAGQGAYGLHKIERDSGYAHLDVYFDENTLNETCDLFINFIEEHLNQYGVEINKHIVIICSCGVHFPEDWIRRRITNGYGDIRCPVCDRRIEFIEGARRVPEYDILSKKAPGELKSTNTFARPDMVKSVAEPIWILHLSDLHMTPDVESDAMLQPLVADLTHFKSEGGFAIEKLDYLVISGDVSSQAHPEEFEKAYQLISKLIDHFELSIDRCIIVPGNHDLDWSEPVYTWNRRCLDDTKGLKKGTYIKQPKVLGIRNETRYPLRFRSFSENFYHPLMQLEYPLEFEEQCIPVLFEDTGIQFLAINSCWEIDAFFQDRSSIHDEALIRCLEEADLQIARAQKEGHLLANASVLRIAVWHHPLTGNDRLKDDVFLERLRGRGVQLCLHGHIHQQQTDYIGYLHPTQELHIIGAGSFGTPMYHRPESVPRFYNVLEVDQDYSKIRVHTRCLWEEEGVWEGWAAWHGSSPTKKQAYYDIVLTQFVEETATPIPQETRTTSNFDVFLCHNSVDKPIVKEIGQQLKERGIRPWLDEWELRPGLSWLNVLEELIIQIRTAAVFIGCEGLGPWQQQEIKLLFRKLVNQGCTVIPVILPDAPQISKIKIPYLLEDIVYVDFRKDDPDPLQQLIWGITGKKIA